MQSRTPKITKIMVNKNLITIFSLIICFVQSFSQGSFHPAAGKSGSSAMFKDSTAFHDWATMAVVERGYQNIADTSLSKADLGTELNATGKPDGTIISLGDGGTCVLTFKNPVTNGFGYDFAVFENSFSDDFLELAFVEVSSDGVNFYRFEAVSQTQNSQQTGSFGFTDPTDLNNLAGKYRGQYGTPFDLDELKGINGLDINQITHIKLIDVIGSVDSLYATYDSKGNSVNDPWPTPFNSSGFDLDAVGVINSTNKTSVINETNNHIITVFPNPFSNKLHILLKDNNLNLVFIYDINGKLVFKNIISVGTLEINTEKFEKGVYVVKFVGNEIVKTHRLIK